MSERVCAVVVTFNRQALLRACLTALHAQTRPVDTILVVDNASTDGTLAMLQQEFPQVALLALPRNVGGAGGFHAGMEWAFEHGFDWLWLMDDDGRAAPDCLAKLLEQRQPDDSEPNGVFVPVQLDSSGRHYGFGVWRGHEVDVTREVIARTRHVDGPAIFRFVGALIGRAIVEQVGLPHKDFFIWFDDSEYALRIHSKTSAQVIFVPDAVFFHDFGGAAREVRFLGRRSTRSQQPAWKLYYGNRNHLYTVMRTRRSPRESVLFVLLQLRPLVGELVYEPDRWERAKMRLLGIWDGALGRLGKRV